MEIRSRTNWEAQGWEFVSQEQGRVQSTLTFRKPNTKLPVWAWAVPAAVVVVGFSIIIVMNIVSGGGDVSAKPVASSLPTTTVAEPVVTPSGGPTVAPAPSEPAAVVVSPVSDGEVVAFFQTYFDERRAAGVVFAQAITGVTFANRILQVTFDSAAVGMDWQTFDYVTPFGDNYAEFVVNPMASSVGIAPNVRASMDAVETFQADGTPRGMLTTEWVVEMNELD